MGRLQQQALCFGAWAALSVALFSEAPRVSEAAGAFYSPYTTSPPPAFGYGYLSGPRPQQAGIPSFAPPVPGRDAPLLLQRPVPWPPGSVPVEAQLAQAQEKRLAREQRSSKLRGLPLLLAGAILLGASYVALGAPPVSRFSDQLGKDLIKLSNGQELSRTFMSVLGFVSGFLFALVGSARTMQRLASFLSDKWDNDEAFFAKAAAGAVGVWAAATAVGKGVELMREKKAEEEETEQRRGKREDQTGAGRPQETPATSSIPSRQGLYPDLSDLKKQYGMQ